MVGGEPDNWIVAVGPGGHRRLRGRLRRVDSRTYLRTVSNLRTHDGRVDKLFIGGRNLWRVRALHHRVADRCHRQQPGAKLLPHVCGCDQSRRSRGCVSAGIQMSPIPDYFYGLCVRPNLLSVRKTNLERGLIAFVFELLCLTGDLHFGFPQFFL